MIGNIPVLHVEGNSIAEAWEKSLLDLYFYGCDIKTEYDKIDDPPSKDCSMTIVVNNPLSEPRIHRCIPCGLEDLQEYVLEVTEGIKDNLIDTESNTKWQYTYHSRLTKYSFLHSKVTFNQIENIAQILAQTPYSRRAQAITWKVWVDSFSNDPPCLQKIWCRILPDENDDWVLNMNVSLRSNDAYRAAFMNMYAFVRLQEKIANRISELSGKIVKLGRYCHQADSYHIYGSNSGDFEDRFLKSLGNRTFKERTYRYEDVEEILNFVNEKYLKN
jgi:thymidylate synthase